MTIREWCSEDERELKRLFLEYCAATKQTGDADACWIGWQAQEVTVLVAEQDGRLCGFGSLLTVPLAVSPYKAGVPQMLYGEPGTRAAVLLMKAGIAWYKQQGITSLLIYTALNQEKLWAKRHFRPKLMVMERSL